MKTLKEHINEALKIGKDLSGWSSYTCQPKTNEELKDIIKDRISKEGPNCYLNDIDVSQITNMSGLFFHSKFNGDISKWDVSNVTDMSNIFNHANDFNGDISDWNTSKVEDMRGMFKESNFTGDISKWDVSNVKNMGNMFQNSVFNGDISKWDVSNVKEMSFMFTDSRFNQDISNWKINKDCKVTGIFIYCPIEYKYRPKLPKQQR